jgi:hypothetical protein
MIPWRPIAELPDELKDGRGLLLGEQSAGAFITYQGWYDVYHGRFLLDSKFTGEFVPTHFAEITPPAQPDAARLCPSKPTPPPLAAVNSRPCRLPASPTCAPSRAT